MVMCNVSVGVTSPNAVVGSIANESVARHYGFRYR